MQKMQDTFTTAYSDMNRSGFPHSDTAGLKDRGSYPTNIVTMYVLLRYFVPSHPLSALKRLIDLLCLK
ncbi:MAG: hypothetical protein US53_C0044G0003 [Candidatus Woesebacteria bacterium GW2011_GWA1_37_7]|uniref:Uncharacterized protein n=1 Tax=Candidatus Woesebacteria bacterium GW2011_GWA1_37_7 TaxID=1618545 RepID=A0A0G0K7R1_9BACT|nr:MAG: hypothetical protein US53_C0044G0003 [Candidatus Woesebacteria bacterium GW2011_GWA1_37_7]